MPKFSYTIKDANGKTTVDVAEAYDKKALVSELQKKGYFVVNVQELTAKLKSKKPKLSKDKKKKKFGHKKCKLQDLINFARQLTTMLDSGVTLLRSLDVIVGQIESEKLYEVVRVIKADVEQGSSLSDALAKHPKVFNQFWVSLIEVGEASGTMPMVLDKLSFYLEQEAAFKSTIVSAIIYPCILFFVSCGAIAFFALVVGPKFEAIFTQMNVELPLLTKVLLGLFNFIRQKFLWLIGGAFGIVFLFKRYIKTYNGRLQFERMMYSMPVIGEIYKLIVLERFSSQMAILIDSGVPILYALDITQRLVDNHTCSIIVGDIKEDVRQGKLLVDPMAKSGFFPGMTIQMIMVGEETGELSKMLKHVAKYYQETVETFMKRLGTIIEPFMLVFMGGVIGIIVLSMFLPMFNLATLGGTR